MKTSLNHSVPDIAHILADTKEIADTVVERERISADEKALWVKESMEALKARRITALMAPQDCGGFGYGLLAMVRVCEILGRSYASVGLCFGMHCVGTAVIAARATQWQKQTYLAPIAEGRHITTLALSEKGSGAHFYFPQTSLVAVSENSFLVNGEKTFVTNGSHADSYVVSTLGASEEALPDQFSCIVLDNDTNGMHWGKEWSGLGMRGNASRSLALTNVTISDRHILGERGDQLWFMFNVIAPCFLIAMAATYLGIAQRALEEGQNILKKRAYAINGTTLAQVSVLQHRLGVLWARVSRTRALIFQAAEAGDAGESDAMLSILAAKAEVANCCVDTVNDVMTLAGGIGYESNSLLSLLLRDARAAHVMTPTTDILYTWIGRTLLDQPLFSE